jgi:hypothetical protein
MVPTGEPGSRGAASPEGLPDKVDWNVCVLVDGIALQRGYAAAGETCMIPGLGDVPVDWVRSILPLNVFEVLVHNSHDITTYASSTRYTPRPIKVAINVRDHECVVPGCHRKRRTERDHRENFADTHRTTYDDLALLWSSTTTRRPTAAPASNATTTNGGGGPHPHREPTPDPTPTPSNPYAPPSARTSAAGTSIHLPHRPTRPPDTTVCGLGATRGRTR